MQEHPVPQNVTGYEFHLIGQMTLKQFFTAGLGVLFAIISNATNLPEIFKYPLIFIFGVGGFAMAFVPYEGRSLDKWLIAFIQSIYKPTLFFWKKTNPVPDVFSYVQPRFLDTTPTVDYSGVRTQRAKDFLKTIPGNEVTESSEPDEDVSAILALFSQPLQGLTSDSNTSASLSNSSIMTGGVEIQATPKIQKPSFPVFQQSVKEVIIKPAPQVIVEKREEVAPPKDYSGMTTSEVTSGIKKQIDENLAQTVTSSSLPFPKPPTKPNMLVGMTFSQDRKIIDNAIVEIIRTNDGTPVRALKTNPLGQFAIITPLENGEYEITVEKDGYHFDKTLLVLNNEVVQPILIQAK